MHVVLLNQFYPPARAPTGKLLHDLACVLDEHGHQVTVITSAGIYGGSEASPAEVNDASKIRIDRLGPSAGHGQTVIRKLIDYLSFFPRAHRCLCQLDPQPDVVVVMTTPPFCASIARRYQRRTGVPYVIWNMDLYPEALAANRMLRSHNPLYQLLYRRAARERNDAIRVISLGADMTHLIVQSAPTARVVEVPVWSKLAPDDASLAAAERLRSRRGWHPEECIFMYSGNIGRAHRMEEFGALAEAIAKENLPARVVISGDGPSKARWQRHAAGARIEWIDPVADADVVAHLLSADVHLISQEPAWQGVVVPSKYQAACALGRPVLFAGPETAAVAEWIRQDDTGWIILPGQQEPLTIVREAIQNKSLLRDKGWRAREQAQRLFERSASCRVVISLLEEIAGAKHDD